jgi:hypothetical protein
MSGGESHSSLGPEQLSNNVGLTIPQVAVALIGVQFEPLSWRMSAPANGDDLVGEREPAGQNTPAALVDRSDHDPDGRDTAWSVTSPLVVPVASLLLLHDSIRPRLDVLPPGLHGRIRQTVPRPDDDGPVLAGRSDGRAASPR